MRWLVLVLLAWVGSVAAQFDLDTPESERVNIEVVPVLVIGQHTNLEFQEDPQILEDVAYDLLPQFTEMFVSTRDAIYVLGLAPWEYTLRLGNRIDFLACEEASTLSEQACFHLELGVITD